MQSIVNLSHFKHLTRPLALSMSPISASLLFQIQMNNYHKQLMFRYGHVLM